MFNKINITNILKNIDNGVFRILPKKDGRSNIWKFFHQIEKDDGTIIQGVVICRICKRILKYNGRESSNLNRHKCYKRSHKVVIKEEKSEELFKVMNTAPLENIENGVTLQVSSEDKENLLVAYSQWVVEDCRPFSIVDGEGFRKLAQSLLNIGTKYGNVINISDIVPDSGTISQRINAIAEEKRWRIKEELEMAVMNGTASISTDFWTDNCIKRHFLCVTFHFIKDLKLKQIVLGVKSMDFQRCATENIIEKLNSILKDFEVNSMENIIFVTDRESKIVKALKDQNRINCAIHLLNNVLDSSLSRTSELMQLFESCKKLVKYCKQTSLQNMLSSTPRRHCTARWNSHLYIFKSILNKFFEIQEFLSSIDEIHRISDIDLSVLTAVVGILEKFNIVSGKFQDLKDVTINYVYLTINTIKNICEERYFDVEIIKALKRNILKEMETKYIANLNIIHYTACFLYPPTNSCLDESILKEVKSFCVSEISKTVQLIESPANSKAFDESPQDFQLFFSNLITLENPSVTESISDELNRYSYLKTNVDVNFDVLQWWENHSSEYPKLYKFAQRILAIPASSAASERVISAAGNIITEKLKRIGPQTVNNLFFLNSIDKYEKSIVL